MRRAFVAVVGTVFGLVLVLGYKSSGKSPTASGAVAAGSLPPTTAPPTAAAPTTAPAPTDPATPTTTTPAPARGNATLTGPDVPNQYGDVQVQIVMQSGRIVDVKALQLPQDRQRSAEISQYAAPILRDEVIHAQGANIDGVSGASYTSASYAQSVQAALDQAHG